MQQPPVLKQDDLQYIAGGLIASSLGVYFASHVVDSRFLEGAP